MHLGKTQKKSFLKQSLINFHKLSTINFNYFRMSTLDTLKSILLHEKFGKILELHAENINIARANKYCVR